MTALTCDRREFLAMTGAAMSLLVSRDAGGQSNANGGAMYGLLGKINATPGQRDALAAILLQSGDAMPGCLSYIVAADPADANGLWVTEVWESQGSHQASLSLPAVQAAIAKGRPMIAGFSNRVETQPLGGIGLPKRK
jgi:quinol monooxygenase YgiN